MGLQVSSIIFLDSPVGTGFSYASTEQGLKTSDTKSSVDVHTFLRKVIISVSTQVSIEFISVWCKVSQEYGYRVALIHFRAWNLKLEIEEDPYATLSEDDNVPMEEVPFNDSDPLAA
ncbi:hypothetical protein B296_00000043 [Ensete ventricosum]|uniref:Uncharacterized protein n=1 Tax=Ensete ventricosum TaxID=4639 RepID=A0A427AVK0_ENSVE|nr:hypothetical protein B296_00000043 [Ensete ventricosum]